MRLSKAPKIQKSKVFLAFLENYAYPCPKKTKRNGTMEKDNYQLPPVWDVITHLLQELENAGWDYVNFYEEYDHE